MTRYFYSDGKNNHGPYTVEELKEKTISPETLVWCEGMEDWQPARQVPELQVVLQSSPPPLRSSAATGRTENPMLHEKPPRTWLVESILVTIFCCLPFGIIGIVNASKVESRFYAQDMTGAIRASREAGKWTQIGFWIGLITVLIYFFLLLVGAISGF